MHKVEKHIHEMEDLMEMVAMDIIDEAKKLRENYAATEWKDYLPLLGMIEGFEQMECFIDTIECWDDDKEKSKSKYESNSNPKQQSR